MKFAWDDHRKTQQITPEICQFAFAQAENLTKEMGKICKNHEEKHKIDVKENEKSGEMRGFATPKQGMRGQKQGMRALSKRAHPLWRHFAKTDQIHN